MPNPRICLATKGILRIWANIKRATLNHPLNKAPLRGIPWDCCLYYCVLQHLQIRLISIIDNMSVAKYPTLEQNKINAHHKKWLPRRLTALRDAEASLDQNCAMGVALRQGEGEWGEGGRLLSAAWHQRIRHTFSINSRKRKCR